MLPGFETWCQYAHLTPADQTTFWNGLNAAQKNELLNLSSVFYGKSGGEEEGPTNRQKTGSEEEVLDTICQNFRSTLQAVIQRQANTFRSALQFQSQLLADQIKRQQAQVLDQCQHQQVELKMMLRPMQSEGHKKFSMGSNDMSIPRPLSAGGHCGYGPHYWNKKTTTTFGRQFQYLRGHDLFCSHFQEEFELNFRFDSPADMLIGQSVSSLSSHGSATTQTASSGARCRTSPCASFAGGVSTCTRLPFDEKKSCIW